MSIERGKEIVRAMRLCSGTVKFLVQSVIYVSIDDHKSIWEMMYSTDELLGFKNRHPWSQEDEYTFSGTAIIRCQQTPAPSPQFEEGSQCQS